MRKIKIEKGKIEDDMEAKENQMEGRIDVNIMTSYNCSDRSVHLPNQQTGLTLGITTVKRCNKYF